jgi:hypothetical protein
MSVPSHTLYKNMILIMFFLMLFKMNHSNQWFTFDAISRPTDKVLSVDKGSVLVKKGSILNVFLVEEEGFSCIPAIPKVIPSVHSQHAPCPPFPPVKASTVELPSREKKTEPVQDPVPRVKGIRGTHPHNNTLEYNEKQNTKQKLNTNTNKTAYK